MDPKDITLPAQWRSTTSIAYDKGALWEGPSGESCLKSTIPVATKLTDTYKAVAMTREAIIPRGMFFCGCLVSSARELTISNPRYAKKTLPAPAKRDAAPYGKKELFTATQLLGLTRVAPTAAKKRSTNTLSIVMMTLNVEDVLIPNSITIVHTKTMNAAAGLRYVDPHGMWFSHVGVFSNPQPTQKS